MTWDEKDDYEPRLLTLEGAQIAAYDDGSIAIEVLDRRYTIFALSVEESERLRVFLTGEAAARQPRPERETEPLVLRLELSLGRP
jgi:hypothetical protein